MSTPERRGSERFPILIDVVICDGSERHVAEIRDVSSSGLGLVLTTDGVSLKNGASATIEFDASSGFRSPLSGTFRMELSPVSYRPNIRSVGFCIDSICRNAIEAILHECTRVSPSPLAEVGFVRAWNMLNAVERTSLKDFFETLLTTNADAARIIDNLMTDPNCSAIRLLHLMRVLLQRLHANSGVATFPVLKKAFDVYALEHSVEDTQKDRLIKYELGSSRLASI